MSSCETCKNNGKCTTEDKAKCQYIDTHKLNSFKHIIGVLSGKGGVGKSTVAANLALSLKRQGYTVGVLDADITGPSIPRILNVETEKAYMYEDGLYAVEVEKGLKAMSLNFLIDQENKPVIWRGPMITSTIKQFYQEVIWGELDYLIIDMPPGTGDVALTIMQTIPLDGIVMVSVPQDMVNMIVSKAVNMTRKLGVEVLGLVENMSYIKCPKCGDKINIFDTPDKEKFLVDEKLDLLATFPINTKVVTKNTLDNEAKISFDNMTANILAKIK